MEPLKSTPKPQSILPIAWEEIREPGAYVEIATGALYRIPRESLVGGAFPLVEQAGNPAPQPVRADNRPARDSQFVRVSRNAHIFSLGARLICVEYHIQPRF